MAVLVTPNRDILDEIFCTPDLEGGIGPVLIGDPLIGVDGRCAVCHPWNEVSEDWLAAYVQGIQGAQVLDELPGDWQYPASEV